MQTPVPVADMIRPFVDAGIVPDNCRRVIIDLQADDVVRIYYEIYGDDRIIDLIAKMVADARLPKAEPTR